ncbi:MAG: hypothetical protein R3E66_23230 [bacterium]
MFFGGEFSHAVFKTPKLGDFRVQSDHGGSVELRPFAPSLLADAQRALNAVPFETTYARVDGLDIDGRLEVMEIELIEPELFTRYVVGSAQKFADIIQRRL